MKKILYIFLTFVLGLGFTACEPEFESPIGDESYTSGSADFSKFVSVGNSLTAGYTNGTLYKSGQSMSFPSILARQMKLVGGGEFTQPYMDDDTEDIGGMLAIGNPILEPKLIIDASEGRPERINKTPTIEMSALHPGPYNNMGVPGAKIFHLLAIGYGNSINVAMGKANPYFVRMASEPNKKVIEDVVAQNPTFFTLWIGNNDVLAFATSGGTGVYQANNNNPATYGHNDITSPAVFGAVYQQLLDALTANGAKGVVANLPDVASIPYFTTVPYNPIPMTEQATVDALNTAYTPYNQGLQAMVSNGIITADEATRRTISFAIGANALVIEDEYLTDLSSYNLPSIRQATADDLLVLPSKGIIGKPDPNDANLVMGVTSPLDDQWVLLKDEVNTVRTATAAYNGIIATLADAKDIPVVDMASEMNKMISGLRIDDNSIYTADYFNGTNLDEIAFGLDGVHPNPRGYAILANKFIEEINKKYGSTLPKVIPGNYPAITILGSN